MQYCIETHNLSHSYYSGEGILHGINIKVPEGAIYGFLGANGAGKTTTLKLLTGLLSSAPGAVTVYNQPLRGNRLTVMRQMGALIESPSFYSHLSARENLEVFRRLYQCAAANITEALALVGLENTGSKKAGRFSLGMKQRLGIAMALLHKPSLLILDEPTNGLDPQGMIEIRELFKTLNREQHVSIVISSHILSEMEKLATHIGIIHKGRLLFQGPLAELMAIGNQQAGGPRDLETLFIHLVNTAYA
jgi:ABC-2 type transport system ATP-binding protein